MVTREGREVPAGVLLVRDTDERSGKPEGRARRTTDYRALVDALRGQLETNPSLARLGICLALPHPELEAWILNGFEPQDEQERAQLEALTAELGFDPTTSPERLKPGRVHRPDDGEPIKRSTKRVLAALIAEDDERRLSCWQKTSLETLRERGQNSGLCAFFAELDARVCPTLDPDPSIQ